MFKRLIQMMKEALRKWVEYKDVKDALGNEVDVSISDAMQEALDEWYDIYHYFRDSHLIFHLRQLCKIIFM